MTAEQLAAEVTNAFHSTASTLTDGRMSDQEFCRRYPGVVAMSSNGKVSSALTRRSYIWHDWTKGSYVIESR